MVFQRTTLQQAVYDMRAEISDLECEDGFSLGHPDPKIVEAHIEKIETQIDTIRLEAEKWADLSQCSSSQTETTPTESCSSEKPQAKTRRT